MEIDSGRDIKRSFRGFPPPLPSHNPSHAKSSQNRRCFRGIIERATLIVALVFAPLRIIIRKNFSNLEFVESKSKFEGIRSISKKKNNPSLLVSFLSSQKFFQTDARETKIPLPSFQKASSSSFSSIRTNPLATEYNLVTGKREEASQMPFDSLSTSLPPCKFIRTNSSSFFLNKLDRLETD